ncbi:MAG: 4-hydroxybenzoate octaprenyltransferase [Methyloceanibacter sp.]
MPRSLAEGKAGAVADARPENLVDRFAPAALLPYLRLARADRPTGFWLLAMPCFWSVALASRSIGAEYPDPWLLLLFAIGAFVMRGAGCTYNDILDRDIDGQVARTQTRPLPSGQVTAKSATIFMLALCLIGLMVLLSFNAATIWLGLGVLPIVALYPLVKRFSHWPQAVLGLAFSWGVLVGYAAVLGRLEWAASVLYGGAVAWTIGYDTIYALQDREDDALLGLKSTALKFGRATKAWLAGLYAVAWLGITLAGMLAGAEIVFLLGMSVGGAQLFWQVATLDIDDPENCLKRFRSNFDFGAIVFAAIVLDTLLASAF